MHQKLQGIIIRKRRQEMVWSQTTLCEGICTESYLSRIEHGKVEGSLEVLSMLFGRLGVTWRGDPEFCRETSARFETWYDRLFMGDEIDEIGPILTQHREEYRNSPFFLDWLLLTWQINGQQPEEIEEYIPAMDERQYNLYLCLTEQFEKLLRVSDKSYYLLEAGKRSSWRGDYTNAVVCLQRGMMQACQEGSLLVQMQCRIYLGNCYCGLDQLRQAQEHYAAAGRMARILKYQKEMEVIAYNQATTELRLGLTEVALRHLLESPWNEGVYFHKLAICYERLGQKDKARTALAQALTAPMNALSGDPSRTREIFEHMCELVHWRVDDPNFLKNPEYGQTLRTCIYDMERQFSKHFASFYAGWLVEWYKANRQYQKVYEVLQELVLKNAI